MKKFLKVALLLGIGFLSFSEFIKPSIENTKNHKFIAFGKVDFSDDDDDYEYESDETSWFENFIKNHKTPFSKTIQK